MRATASLLWLLVVGACATGCSSADPTSEDVTRTPGAASASPISCESAVRLGPLPEWARSGFTPPDQAVRYVIGERSRIVGVVFGYPLTAPRGQGDRNNKILWVGNAAEPGAPPDLVIVGHLNGTATTARRTVAGGPGPSIVDMPKPGCWTFDLTWSGVHDRLAVPYGS